MFNDFKSVIIDAYHRKAMIVVVLKSGESVQGNIIDHSEELFCLCSDPAVESQSPLMPTICHFIGYGSIEMVSYSKLKDLNFNPYPHPPSNSH